MDEELELLRAWKDGDDAAGNRLFGRYFDAVYYFFYGKVEDAQAEELTQDTFMALARSRDAKISYRSFRAYLFAIARNKLYDALRKRARAAPVDDLSQSALRDLGPTPSGAFSRHEEQQILLQALRGLPLEHQLLLELRYFERLAGPELAQVLDIPEGTVRSRLRRAHALLREELERLARSPGQVESTMTGLDDWARIIREHLAGR